MRTLKAFALMLVALVLLLTLGPVVWLVQHIRYPLIGRSLERLYWDTAIGLDQLGGAILYGEPDWTISSRTYYLAHVRHGAGDVERWLALAFERLIDALFGRGHCRKSYENEILKKGGNDG